MSENQLSADLKAARALLVADMPDRTIERGKWFYKLATGNEPDGNNWITCAIAIDELEKRIERREAEKAPESKRLVEKLTRDIRIMQEAAERRNKELDALRYVWCSGGCGAPLTEELVAIAEENTRRMRRKLACQGGAGEKAEVTNG